jgi:hypothetical protein
MCMLLSLLIQKESSVQCTGANSIQDDLNT